MANFRVERVQQEIFRDVTEILRTVVKDPRVEGVTITGVSLTGDLQQATIYYSSLSELASARQAEQTGLDKAKGIVRKELGNRLSIYKIPELTFKRDESVDYGNRIEELIRQMNQQ
ncbi:30S ribosome-binding factor RbfA [Carnobacteriaceae bacterium zg-ZUI252]|nr:30S ribosome-binding factor RbfA [Carnobacteriaceae bacterium zg-ZUI252]MBS4770172.1 30S ribosome-binding factor RbfA [Carnobacteriaceae bacterium zg-ZUI240]QTU82766.1 30S ribosome-binding factor RbfA [Carnobacteriaceae bacterium zg-C25]